MTAYGIYALVLTVVVMVGIAVFILLFERRRARQIEHDLGAGSGRRPSSRRGSRR
jgi:hypothetical protein